MSAALFFPPRNGCDDAMLKAASHIPTLESFISDVPLTRLFDKTSRECAVHPAPLVMHMASVASGLTGVGSVVSPVNGLAWKEQPLVWGISVGYSGSKKSNMVKSVKEALVQACDAVVAAAWSDDPSKPPRLDLLDPAGVHIHIQGMRSGETERNPVLSPP